MKQVTLMDLLDSSIFNTNSLAPTLYLSESDENYLNRENKDKVFSLVKLLNGAEANCSLSAKMITEMSFFQLN